MSGLPEILRESYQLALCASGTEAVDQTKDFHSQSYLLPKKSIWNDAGTVWSDNSRCEIKEDEYEQSAVSEKAPETDLSKFDYNEYFEYCKANAVSNTPDSGKTVVDRTQGYESVRIMNFGKALGSYANTNVNYSTTQISSYA